MASDLNDLIENPRETLDIELKEWLDLSEPLARANIARHSAALANHGGGYLVFGFKDDLSRDEKQPISIDNYNRDSFTAIIKRYLTPAFQCEVSIIPDKEGNRFSVVRIPGHGRTPIVAKSSGPSDDTGRTQGIAAGVHYIRKPGPESAPILNAEEWGVLIRRCVLNDRDSLLSDIAGLVQRPAQTLPAAEERLSQWHQEGEQRFLQLLSQAKGLRWAVPLQDHHYQLSYLISTSNDESLQESSLRQVLEEVNNEVRNTVWTGWSMFYPFTKAELAPALHPERPDGSGSDVLETNLMGDGDFDTSLPDFWRMAPDGRATLVRAYREDRTRTVQHTGRAAGTWLSPETVIRETAEIVTHARLLARRFETATQVSFRCTWIGLEGRELADFDASIYWSPGRVAKADRRATEGEWNTAQLAAAWSTIVAELSCPIQRLFGFTDCGPVLVEGMAPRFIKL